MRLLQLCMHLLEGRMHFFNERMTGIYILWQLIYCNWHNNLAPKYKRRIASQAGFSMRGRQYFSKNIV